MSTIVIVSICAAIAAVIGLRVYFEHKEEKELEKAGNEDAFSDLQAFVMNPYESTDTPVAIEEKPENQPVAEAPSPTFADVENINSTEAQAEAKPKKKKRYYYPKKKQGTKPKEKKQTKK